MRCGGEGGKEEREDIEWNEESLVNRIDDFPQTSHVCGNLIITP